MKKITLLITLMIGSLGFSQQQSYNLDFEPGTQSGKASNWITFDNSPALAEVITNPNPNGVNTSNTTKVLKVVVGPTNAFYAGVNNKWEDSKFGTWKIDASVPSNLTISMDINKSYVGTVGIKMGTNSGATPFQITDQNVNNTIVDEWQTLTWTIPNIPATLETNISQFVILVDWTDGQPDRATGSTILIDNIKFNAEKITDPPIIISTPTSAATTPTKPAQNVISMFSNAYTNVVVDTWRTGWSAADLTDLQIVGDDTKKYSALDFVGIETMANKIDASSMTYFHVDVWTPDMTSFKIKLVNFGANQTESQLSFTPTQAGWNSIDVPLADFTSLDAKSNIGQLIFSGLPVAAGTVFIDNVYFHNITPTDPNKPSVAATTPLVASSDVISMFSNAYTNVTVDTWRTNWSAADLTELQIAGDDTKKYSVLDFVGIETMVNKIDASDMNYFHVDVWTPNMTAFKIKLVDFTSPQSESQLSFTPTQAGWNSIEIPLADFTSLGSKSKIGQLIFSGSPVSAGILFVDNIYFSKVSSLSTKKFEKSNLKVYPNPATSNLTIESNRAIERVSVHNVLGQEVLSKSPKTNNTTLDISNLQKGTYIVRTTSEGATETTKVIKK